MKKLLTVVETSHFAKRAAKHWTSNELDEFTSYIAGNPECGDVVADTGGVRKVRWASQGRGKRGGARVIYFYRSEAMPLFLLDFYAKNEKTDLDAYDKRLLRNAVKTITERFTV